MTMYLTLDITHMIEDTNIAPSLSASVLEKGNRAGVITWRNSLEYAKDHGLLKNEDEVNHARKYFMEFGAWSEREINGWSEQEVQALTLQHIAGDIREMEMYSTYEEYKAGQEAGTVSSNIYYQDDRWYFSLDL